MKKLFFPLLLLVTTSQQFLYRKIRNTLPTTENNYRLPNNSIPQHYKLNLNPNIIPDNFTFNGELEILLEIVVVTKNLTLHASNLTILEGETNLLGEKEKILPNKHIIDEERDFLILTFSKEIQPGNYTLQLKFYGVISNNDVGLFKNSYKNEENETV